MMTIKERLHSDLAQAMRAGDAERRDVLRLLQAAIKQTEVDERRVLDDAEVQAVLVKQAKQRRESIDDYERGGRAELAAREQRELEIIEGYLPQMMTRAEIEEVVSSLITELGVTDVKEMGRLMGRLMPQLKGQADGRLVNEVARDLLTRR